MASVEDHLNNGKGYRESEQVISDLPSFLRAIRVELLGQVEHWVFRGQEDWSWGLQPRKGRSHPADEEFFIVDRPKFDSAVLTEIKERQRFEDWKAEAVALIPPELPRPDSAIEWLAVGQHYSLPTRLLDWSRNPLVGLYFAVENKSPLCRRCEEEMGSKNDSAFFALTQLPNLESEFEDKPWSIRGVRIYHPPNLVERIGRQSGVFTLHQIGSKHSSSLDLVTYQKDNLWLEDREKNYSPAASLFLPALRKFRIPAGSMGRIRDELRSLGVDEFFAFPDLEGLCRAYAAGRSRRPFL